MQIIEVVHKARKVNVTLIVEKLGLEQPVDLGHLKILRETKFLKTERNGNSILYSIDYEHPSRISHLSGRLVPHSINTLDRINSSDHASPNPENTDDVAFTPMEMKIIRLICEENTDEEIAGKLGLSRPTIEAQTNNIIKKNPI